MLFAFVGAAAAKVRTHYIAADEVMWNYGPTGMNVFKGVPLVEDPESIPFFLQAPVLIGGTYIKALYREYTDETFSELKDLGPEWEHLGFLGPPLYAEVGDSFEIHFRNNARYHFSMYPAGLSHEQQDDDGAAVPPGGEYVYRWDVPGSAGPAPGDWSSTMYQYVSNVEITADIVAGLVGPIIVTAKGMADEDGRPVDVDREFIIMYHTTSEIESRYILDNIEEFLPETPPPEFLASFDWFITNLMHSVNGMMFNNLPGLQMTSYERTRWYVLGMGSDFDIHSVHWHGQTFLDRGLHRGDVTLVVPGIVSVVDMIPDNPGLWLTHCHVNAHVTTGMMALFEVLPLSGGYETARNLATTHELFSSLFDSPSPATAVVHAETYSTDPFSGSPVLRASLLGALTLSLLLLI